MNQVLVTVSRGIIEEVVFFDDPGTAIRALAEYVKAMNVEHTDAALYDADGMVANAKHFLGENDEYVENEPLITEISRETTDSVYIIGNPNHRLGFMVASPDDPLGFADPAEALSQLGQMRQDFGRHLKLYRVAPVNGPVASRKDVEKHNRDCDVGNFDYSLVEEYL
ncbi:MAG: hypothetical protein SWQ30_19310 [Thermodesulfobacteriota bacterium]|nr:hypothetical protein [Thermodesulfobacteriota bacterium]